MSATLHGTPALHAPFPGLRAFEAEESLLFYGREVHVAELLDRLGDNHFVAVTGTSGSGKSSLVKAGLRPAMQRGYLIDATSRWRFATMRPGGAPIEALAESLGDALGSEPIESITRSLLATSAGLTEVVARAGLTQGESLLVIADQFEELFRFDVTRAQQGRAALFVSLLLEASERRDVPVYVVVTMRSEFLGRCSEFTGLAEAFNRSQYLVPRLTRDERREAIERPLRLFATEPAPALVQQVLNDTGDDPDQLPVMQHAMLRTYGAWERAGGKGRIEREHYNSIGGIEHAVDWHGDEIMSGLGAGAAKTVEKLFRSLTVMQGGVALRRPRKLGHLYEIAGANTPDSRKQVDAIISAFADRRNSFLMLSTRELTPDTVVDITHESVIRKWQQLKNWVRDEGRSAEWYADLARDVVRYRSKAASLWQDPELAGVEQRRRDDAWNEAWAEQYRRQDDPLFSEVLSFLDQSGREQAERRREEEEQRNRELVQARALASAKRRQSIVLAMLLAGVGAIAVLFYRDVRKNQQITQATAEYQRLSTESQAAQAKLRDLEAQEASLKTQIAAAATPEEKARLEQLTKEIEAAKGQAKGSQDELSKLKRDRELSDSDRGRLLTQVDDLQKQLTQVTAERDKLQAQKPPTTQTGQDDRGLLQTQLQDERKRSAEAAAEIARLKGELSAALRNPAPATASGTASSVSNATTQDLTRAFTDGVRAYDLGNFKASAQYMQDAIRMQSSVKQPPKDVRMSGTRFVPYAPQSYLGAALFDSKSDCAAVLAALNQAENEPVPPDIRGKLQTARKQCASAQ